MKEYVIISGKGGTGKTSLTAAFATLAKKPVLCDADVDAADLHLLLSPQQKEHHDFMGGHLAEIDPESCTQCGYCREICRYDAISSAFVVDPVSCEGCGVCVDLCPEKAVAFPQQKSGEWYISTTRTGPMVHARLGIAEENSGKLVSMIRRRARQLAEEGGYKRIITDGPPGIGCPVIASISGAEKVVIIVEPTVSGMHDVERVTRLTAHFGIQAMLCVNRYDINPETTEAIEKKAAANTLHVLPRIAFDPDFTLAMVQKKTIVEYAPHSDTSATVRKVWQEIEEHEAQPASQPIKFPKLN